MAGTLIVLSLTASLNPTLVAITSLLLLRDQPTEMMAGFLAGAVTISVSLGIAIVLAFNDLHPTAKSTQHTINPGIDILLGATLLLVAASSAFLMGPSAFHRLTFREGQKPYLVRLGTRQTIVGMAGG